jgi:hypothetical protein
MFSVLFHIFLFHTIVHSFISLFSSLSLNQCNEQSCPVDCVLADWSSWSVCSQTCGGGVKFRKRGVAVAAAHNGAQCTSKTLEEETCNSPACAVDCKWTAWAPWSDCSVACGAGAFALLFQCSLTLHCCVLFLVLSSVLISLLPSIANGRHGHLGSDCSVACGVGAYSV